MQDIADKLDISKVTVSKALNGKDGVGADLKGKIQKTAYELGYHMPVSIKNDGDSPQNIAIFLNEKFADGEAKFYLKCYQCISFELLKLGYLGNLFTVNRISRDKNELTSLFAQNNVCGVILLGTAKKSLIETVKSLGMPLIFVDFYDSDAEVDCVVTENIYSTYSLTNHLLEYGHREIGFVGSIRSTSSIQDRFLGYYRGLLEMNIPLEPQWILQDRNEEDEEIQITLPDQMPTAFVCNCDDTAYHFIKLLNDRGYQVPEDISIVSFDNDIFAELCTPKLTTLAVNIELMGKNAAELIVEKIEKHNEIKHGIIFVNGSIIYRDSVKKIKQEWMEK